ncbi:MAG: hypothetical protein B6I28_03445 [Fusobacteriia bacterium 4572_132]|nr:MAG: hypothetical protein B6I28_03445 [Fusobacteriia bacterium 4572_132]
MKINKILKLLKTFNYSINIQRDYLDEEKINFYMPTYKVIHLINKYIDNITKNGKKSFILSGAYGTGKSFLISLLLHLLNSETNIRKIDTFISKSRKVYSETETLIDEIKNQRQLVVFAEDNYNDFKQAITMGIIKTAKLKNISLNIPTVFRIIIEKIKNWEKNHIDLIKKAEIYLKKENINLKILKKEEAFLYL